MRIIDITHPPQSLWIGREGENTFRPVSFECANWFTTYPNATIAAYYQPYGSADPYPLVLVEDGTKRIWHPLLNELVKGDGELQIVLMNGDTVGTSAIIPTRVDRSLISNADHPADEAPSWTVQVVADVQNAIDGIGETVEELLPDAVEDYMVEHPFVETDPTVPAWAKATQKPSYTAAEVGALPDSYTAPVQSVNGKTGVVVLDASDVGALPDDTPIPAAVTEQTVSGWGFTKNTGTYSKPSGGIPASDIAEGVIPSVPQMATQANMGDWTSGKTVDAATLKTNFIAAAWDLDALSVNKADKTEIPTKVSDLTNDSNFQTAAQVQSAIAAIPDELPTVTASDNGKVLGVVNGAWAVKSDEGGSSVTVDSALSTTSTNPVQNKVVKAALDTKADASALAAKQDALTAGQNVTISGNTISADVDSAEIASNVTNWLDANVNPVGSAVVVDSSLSIEGAAADAKATGDVAFTESAKQALLDSLENVEWIGDGQHHYDAVFSAFGNGQGEVSFADAYEYGEVTPNGNSYTVFPSGDSANKLRARAKQEYIKKIPSGATSCAVTIPTEMFVSGKYKYGWAFYTENFEQIMSTVIGWITSAQTVRSDSIPSNAVYYMIYIASTGSNAINLSEIDYSAASIIFNNSAVDYAKISWGIVAETPKELKTPPTKDPFIFSVNHRGYSTSAPENTLPAFIMSRKKGFRYVETDVLFTSDNVPVLLHDSTINRTARNADGTTISASTGIASITFEQARTYDFGVWKGSEYAGTKIPSFAEFIQLCKQLSITPMIELKNEITWTDEKIAIVADLIRAVGMQNHVVFLSFSYDALAKMRTHFPKAMLGLGFEGTNNVTNITNMANAAKNLQNGENTVCLSLRNSTMTAELFSIIESEGICSFVWTVNTEVECLNLHRNVIGVLSDSLNAGQLIEDALINS